MHNTFLIMQNKFVSPISFSNNDVHFQQQQHSEEWTKGD